MLIDRKLSSISRISMRCDDELTTGDIVQCMDEIVFCSHYGKQNAMANFQLNCEGMNCPMPIVELTKAARSLEAGEKIEVTATDLAFKLDLESWARRMGHTIETFDTEDDVQRAIISLG